MQRGLLPLKQTPPKAFEPRTIRKMLSADEYLPLLETLMTFEPPVHVFGGFAEDALLHGTSVRTHQDVDVLVGREADPPPRIAA